MVCNNECAESDCTLMHSGLMHLGLIQLSDTVARLYIAKLVTVEAMPRPAPPGICCGSSAKPFAAVH